MVFMKDIDEALSYFGFCLKMKQKTMHEVFKQCPAKHSNQKQRKYQAEGITIPEPGVIKQIANQWDINAINYPWPGFTQHFQIPVFENPGLSLVINVQIIHHLSFR